MLGSLPTAAKCAGMHVVPAGDSTAGSGQPTRSQRKGIPQDTLNEAEPTSSVAATLPPPLLSEIGFIVHEVSNLWQQNQDRNQSEMIRNWSEV